MESDSYLTPYTKINSKWIKHLNGRVKTVKLLKGNVDINLHDFGLGNSFLYMIPNHKIK